MDHGELVGRAGPGAGDHEIAAEPGGVEPDLALVKFKKLVGGGSMQIVNQTVPRALKNLGYQPEQIEAITEYIAEHGHVVDAPALRPEHYDVFDCAMGERAISPMGHVRMLAAVQPMLSGSVSKTVNMPESATVAPCACSERAIAPPIAPLAPVTSAALPDKSNIISSSPPRRQQRPLDFRSR